MRKLFILLAATAALFITASCNLNVENDYTFSYELNYQVATDEQEAVLLDYFKPFIENHQYSFHGQYSDALSFGISHFMQDLQLVDDILVQNTLEYDEDAARLLLIMAATNTRVIVAYNTWVGGEDGVQLRLLE